MPEQIVIRELNGRTTVAFPGSFTLRKFPDGDYDALFLYLAEDINWLKGMRVTVSDQLGRSLNLELTGREPVYIGKNGGRVIEAAVSLQVFPALRDEDKTLPSVANLLTLSGNAKPDLAARLYDVGLEISPDYDLKVI